MVRTPTCRSRTSSSSAPKSSDVLATPPALAPKVRRVALADPLFISDLHLSAAHPRTVARFEAFAATSARQHAELLILGDLFEFWPGDDGFDDPVAVRVADALAAVGAAGVKVFFMHGNRDLLLGGRFARRAGATMLADPVIATIGGREVLLSHGDVYCTLDVDYQRFRVRARKPLLQFLFLLRPLAARRAAIGEGRAMSEASKQQKSMTIMDVTPQAIDAALRAARVTAMIHGHTHRPAVHRATLDGTPVERWVLPDWDYDAPTPRGGYLTTRGDAWKMVDPASPAGVT